MPRLSVYASFCPMGVSVDTYKGCSHRCQYCYYDAQNTSMREVAFDEGVEDVQRFIGGERTPELARIPAGYPLRLGRFSDPFQPCEALHRRSLAVVRCMRSAGYPFVFTTKGRMVVAPEYLMELQDCNVVGQVSLTAPSMDQYEPGAPCYRERLEILWKLPRVCRRVIARAQPLFFDERHVEEFIRTLDGVAQAGVYGVLVEAMAPGHANGHCSRSMALPNYTHLEIVRYGQIIRDQVHARGMRFFSGDSCMRHLGAVLVSDSPVCCGWGGLAGFDPDWRGHS